MDDSIRTALEENVLTSIAPMYFVYLLLCKDDSLYTGITNDLEKRLKHHKDGTASSYTRARGAVRFVYTEVQPTKGAALRREAEIKRMTRQHKLKLVASQK